MKHSFLSCIVLALLYSCASDNKPSSEPAGSATETSSIPFSGTWLSESYLKKINSHGSPRKAQEGAEACFIRIPDKTMESTSMHYNFHETGADLVVLKYEDGFVCREKLNDSLTKVIYKIEVLSPEQIKLDGKSFIKIKAITNNNETLILEEVLFKGQYKTNTGQPVEFKNNGEVTGLGKYTHYHPLIDYLDAGMQIDQLGLGKSEEPHEYFGFKFKKGKLEIYHIKCLAYDDDEKRCVDVDFGSLAYELTRI